MKSFGLLSPFLLTSGVIVFLRGFLLTRIEITDINTLACPQSQPRQFDHVFLFVVDALRLDFMTWHASHHHTNVSSSFNRFKFLHEVLQLHPERAALMGFHADPPTTTSQRLKALMAGTFPTFVDISSNFGSSALMEDNLIDQLRRQGRRMVFLGDDTWAQLFPSQFDSSFPFDSFNTRDLDSVDDGIMKQLYDVFSKDWDLAIAHFLGVDHIGHTFHAHDFRMGHRLERMDDILQEIVKRLPQRSLLVLFGDHGMTDEGEHGKLHRSNFRVDWTCQRLVALEYLGGASELETLAGLFVYSTEPIFQTKSSGTAVVDAISFQLQQIENQIDWIPTSQIRQSPRIVSQIDLVPTLALLLGLPIPHSSLGGLIPEFFFGHNNRGQGKELQPLSEKNISERVPNRLLELLDCNANQIQRYLTKYSEESGIPIDAEILRAWESIQRMIVNSSSVCESPENCKIKDKESMFQMFTEYFAKVKSFGREKWTSFDLPMMSSGICIGIIGWLIGSQGLSMRPKISATAAKNCGKGAQSALCVFFSLYSLAYQEVWIHFYVTQSIYILVVVKALQDFKTNKRWCIVASYSIGSIILLRLLLDQQYADMRRGNEKRGSAESCVLVVFTIAALLAISTVEIGFRQAMSYWRPIDLFNGICALISGAMITWKIAAKCIWQTESSEALTKLILVIDRFALSLILIGTLVTLVVNWWIGWYRGLVAWLAVFTYELQCLVSSSATVHRTAVVQILSPLALGLAMCRIVTISVEASPQLIKDATIRPEFDKRGLRKHLVVALAISLSRLLFYFTGHDTKFSSLRLGVGFTGTENFNFYWAGGCLICDTFGAELLGLLVLIYCALAVEEKDRVLLRRDVLAQVLQLTMLCKGLWVLCSCISCAILRRHLMVWAVFAPRMVFECAFWLCTVSITAVVQFSSPSR